MVKFLSTHTITLYTICMIIENPDPNIFVVKNFIDSDQAQSLVNLAEIATDDEWAKYNYTDRDEHNEWENRILMLSQCDGFNDTKKELVANIFLKIQNEINALLNKDIYEYTDFNSIYRSVVGQSMKTHHDAGGGARFKYGVVLYLNDNYKGGEIFYPNIDIEFKPEAYSLVLHPAHEAYRHGVKEVSSGTRYSMTTFLRLK
jgi:hypothetical protein